MAKARKILRRVKTVKNIRTITKTMEMVSTARFKKTHDRAVAFRPYTTHLREMVADLASRREVSDVTHPLLAVNEKVQRAAMAVLTSDRGLAGAFNNSVVRAATDRLAQLRQAGYEVRLRAYGKRGIQILRYRGHAAQKEVVHFPFMPPYAEVARFADEMIAEFLSGQISDFEIAYMQFISAGQQKPAIAQVLPMAGLAPAGAAGAGTAPMGAYELIPSTAELLDHLLPAAVRMRVYQCFLDAAVSEQIARMRSMKLATDNADEMIHRLTIRYNRARQAQITTELAEIMGGRVGLA